LELEAHDRLGDSPVLEKADDPLDLGLLVGGRTFLDPQEVLLEEDAQPIHLLLELGHDLALLLFLEGLFLGAVPGRAPFLGHETHPTKWRAKRKGGPGVVDHPQATS
jgi:hypothetical protein